jgi:hypothetical protein
MALAHHDVLPIDPGTQRAILGFQIALPQRVAHHEHRLLERQWLLDEIERAHLDRPHGRLDVAVARDHHHLRIDAPLPQPLQRHQPVHAGQPDIQHDDVVGRARGTIETFLAAGRRLDIEPLIAQDRAQRRAHARLVVNNQNGGHRESRTAI